MNKQSVNKEVIAKVSTMKPGKVFDYSCFDNYREKPTAIAKALSRLAMENQIKRIERGKYYVPQMSKFGTLKPSENEFLKALKNKNNGEAVYETGLGIYNKLGLTTQVPNVITLATKKQKPSKTISGVKINYTKKNFDISKYDPYLLQLLDAIKDSKNIPDSSPDEVIRVIKTRIRELSLKKVRKLKRASYNYPPFVRAILGAIIEIIYNAKEAKTLKNTLNPLTKYSFPINELSLPNKEKWGIK
ncbi:MAG: DUF6088 family protein [Bacteroidota bacterium]